MFLSNMAFVLQKHLFLQKTSDTADKSQPWETMMVALAAPRSEVEQNLLLKGMELSGHAGTLLEVFQS